MVTVNEIRKAQRAEGLAMVVAIGIASPPNCIDQSTYPDYYLRVTNSEHKTELKEKFKRLLLCPLTAPSHLRIALEDWTAQIGDQVLLLLIYGVDYRVRVAA
ncbi:hypothetical protein FNV43_RR21715 [Rhamnella rubrinervis]|uniref:Chalcone/stilbene synthase N-terminal domain-containing protein n=1 Tax=Rhamnella rubrinervis TaxID=2594499 RepID=A0A8K0DP41_9ROSA|nr:hypothetical protein FNV43_RR21715 [Rhamnella rubrinervis]